MPIVELPDGTSANAVNVDFDHVSEPWGEYELEDGTTLKVRTVVQSIQRLPAEYNPQGNEPIYNVQSNTVVRAVDVPEDLLEEMERVVEPGVE